MKIPSLVCTALLGLIATPIGYAQASHSTAAQVDSEEVVTLSVFEVSSATPARYQAAESAAGGRISANIMSTPTTVTVLTSEFLNDVGGTRVLDATKYVAGVGESTIANSLDRIAIRGFETGGRRVDGFSSVDQANYDQGAIERVEVVKGPDALLHPSGAPGGTINLVTKKPQFTRGGSLKLQVGEYDSNRIEADVTGPLSGLSQDLAYRMVVAVQDNEGYVQHVQRKSQLLTPSLTWRVSPQTNLTARYEYYHFKASNLKGLPVDPSVGTRGGFRVLQGVPRNFNPTFSMDQEFRHVTSNAGTLLFTSTVTERLSVRLAGRIAEITSPNSDMRWGLDAPGGSRNPYTGEWEPGVLWVQTSVDPAPKTFAATPAPQPSSTVTHTGTHSDERRRYRDVQNDWVYALTGGAAESTTMIGFAYGYESTNRGAARRAAQSFDYLNFTGVGPNPVDEPLNTDFQLKVSRYQVYLTQQLELLNKRVVLNGGVSHLSYNGLSGNKLAAATATTVAGQLFPASGSKATYNYGIVVRPLPNISLYYGHTANAVPPNDFRQVAQGDAPLFSEGSQDEVGIKANFLGGRIIASLSYYEIEQTGYPVFNPANIASPPPPVSLPDLILSREASGYELQLTGSVTDSLSIMASYADTKNRDPNGVMLRGSAEDLASLFLRYELQRGSLRGLALALGANYMSKRSVENVSGLTPASTPDNAIPNQPSAYLPARTLVDTTLSYSRGSWSYSLTVNNLLDKENYAAGLARNLVMVGNPRAFSASATWKF